MMEQRGSISSARISVWARLLGPFPVATWCLIALNLFVYLGLMPGNPQYTASWYGVVPQNFHFISIFTSLFIHFELSHLLVNTLFLWIFGRKVELALGPIAFLVLYLLSGFVACLLHVAVVRVFLHNDISIPLVGASGAISGVIGMYAFRFSREKLYVRGREAPALTLLLAWFLFQVALGMAGFTRHTLGNFDLRYVGYWSHVGGFVFGMTGAWFLVRRERRRGKRAGHAEGLRERTLAEIALKLEILAAADPLDPFAYSELGRIRALLGDQEGSVASFLAAADLCRKLGAYSDAVAALHEMLGLWPEVTLSCDTVFKTACFFEILGEPEQAADRFAWLAVAAEGQPEGQMALLKLGQVELNKLCRPEKAIPPIEKLLAQCPESKWADTARKLLARAHKMVDDGLGGGQKDSAG